jgi:hypothetical protein
VSECLRVEIGVRRGETRRDEARKIEVERQGKKKDNERSFRKSAYVSKSALLSCSQ